MSKRRMFPKTPICEMCGKEEAISFSWNAENGWTFSGMCYADFEEYYVEFKRFFSSPAATVDWIAHLYEKDWFVEVDFLNMMNRFRKATNSYGRQ